MISDIMETLRKKDSSLWVTNVCVFLLTNQELIYQSDEPNYPLIRTLLNSLQQDLRLFIDPPDGTKEHPATTCLELMICHPNYTNGITLFFVTASITSQMGFVSNHKPATRSYAIYLLPQL